MADLLLAGFAKPPASLAKALLDTGTRSGVFSWDYLCEATKDDEGKHVTAEGDDWITWRSVTGTIGIAVLQDNGEGVRCFYIAPGEQDLFKAQNWISSLAEGELVRATLALEAITRG